MLVVFVLFSALSHIDMHLVFLAQLTFLILGVHLNIELAASQSQVTNQAVPLIPTGRKDVIPADRNNVLWYVLGFVKRIAGFTRMFHTKLENIAGQCPIVVCVLFGLCLVLLLCLLVGWVVCGFVGCWLFFLLLWYRQLSTHASNGTDKRVYRVVLICTTQFL